MRLINLFKVKENSLIKLFFAIFLISFVLVSLINVEELYKSDYFLLLLNVLQYAFPITIISMTTFMLLIAHRFWGLKVFRHNILKKVIVGILILLGIWYILLVNNFHGPLRLPEFISTSKLLSIEIFQYFTIPNLLSYRNVIFFQAYGIGLYCCLA